MKLYKHQKEAIEFARRGSVALFHEAGLGKTLSALKIFTESNKSKLLVICPKILINNAWIPQIEKFTSCKYCVYPKINDEVDVVLINYEKMVSAKHFIKIYNLIDNDWMVVLDESQKIKNHKAKTTKNILKLKSKTDKKLILTGTLAPNDETEFWSQITFINSNIFPSSFYKFRNIYFILADKYGRKIEVKDYKMIQEFYKRGYKYILRPDRKEEFYNKLKQVVHWRKKEECLDLPKKNHIEIRFKLSNEEKKYYEQMRKYMVIEIPNLKQYGVVNALAKVMKLRQITSGFYYAENEILRFGQSKLNTLMEILEEIGNEQVIIWTQYTEEANQIRNLLPSSVVINKDTEDRDQDIKDFIVGNVQYMIAMPLCMRYGLTFTNCNYAVYYSKDFSYETFSQSQDRIHRIGTKKPCFYYHLIAEKTIDEYIHQVVNRKKKLEDALYDILRS